MPVLVVESLVIPGMSWSGVQGSSRTWERRDGAFRLLPSSPCHCRNRQTFHRYRLGKILLFRSVAFSLIWLKAFGFESECCLSWEPLVEQPVRKLFKSLKSILGVQHLHIDHWSLIIDILIDLIHSRYATYDKARKRYRPALRWCFSAREWWCWSHSWSSSSPLAWWRTKQRTEVKMACSYWVSLLTRRRLGLTRGRLVPFIL